MLPPLLRLLHAVLLAWALMGLAEWFAPSVPWPRVANPAFPRWLLMLHWVAVLAAALVYLLGDALRWRHMPAAMVVCYAGMALVCAIETFGYLTHELRFVAMVMEYAAYAAILLALHRLPAFVTRFDGGRAASREDAA